MPPASDPSLTSINDRLDTIEERLTSLETATPRQPDKDGKVLGMTIGIVVLLFIVAAGVLGLVALWRLVA